MKKSDKLSKKNVNFTGFNTDKNLILVYKRNKKILREIKGIKKRYKLTDEEILNLVKKYAPIPISIFKNNSLLEALVKYLKDNLSLSLKEISTLLNRDQRTIWITYNNSIKSIKELDTNSKIKIPLNYFAERKLSILENLVDRLIDLHYSVSKISSLLNRNYKTIYTVYQRIKEKDAKSR